MIQGHNTYSISFYFKDQYGNETRLDKTLEIIPDMDKCDRDGLLEIFREFLLACGFHFDEEEFIAVIRESDLAE